MTHICGTKDGDPRDVRDEHGCGEAGEPHWPTAQGLDGLIPICARCCEEAGLCNDDEEDWP